MSEDWKAGDLAVRVEFQGPDPLALRRCDSASPPPPIGRPVRVAGVVVAGYVKELGLVIAGWPSTHPSKAWHHLMFKKFNDGEDDAELIAMIRGQKPVRVIEPTRERTPA